MATSLFSVLNLMILLRYPESKGKKRITSEMGGKKASKEDSDDLDFHLFCQLESSDY